MILEFLVTKRRDIANAWSLVTSQMNAIFEMLKMKSADKGRYRFHIS